MKDMNGYYDFSGQKFGYPLSLSINGFSQNVFTRQSSLELSYVLCGEYEAVTEQFSTIVHKEELILIAPYEMHLLMAKTTSQKCKCSENAVGKMTEKF